MSATTGSKKVLLIDVSDTPIPLSESSIYGEEITILNTDRSVPEGNDRCIFVANLEDATEGTGFPIAPGAAYEFISRNKKLVNASDIYVWLIGEGVVRSASVMIVG